jgi:hypothetical protein
MFPAFALSRRRCRVRTATWAAPRIAGPGLRRSISRYAKTFSITERVKAKIRADAFNAFNRVNLNNR